LVTKGSVKKVGEEFVVEGEMKGTSAKELNRSLLSALRRVEKKTRLRAEWTSDNNTTERFFDYVLKKTIKNQSARKSSGEGAPEPRIEDTYGQHRARKRKGQ
jgi:hypothetical protein